MKPKFLDKKLLIFVLANLILISLPLLNAIGQNPTISGVTQDIYPKTGSINDNFQLHVNLNWQDNSQAPQIASNQDFEVVGESRRSSTEIVNGNISISMSYTFVLKPLRVGTLTTPSVTLNHNSQKYTLEGLKVIVNSDNQQRKSEKISKTSDIFAEQSTNKLEAYVGEQIYLNHEFLAGVSVYELEPKPSIINGVWQEELKQTDAYETSRNGRRYKAMSFEYVIFPTNSGKLKLNPKEFIAKVNSPHQRPQGSIFDMDPFDLQGFFGASNTQKVRVASNPLEIEVMELPESGETIYRLGNQHIPVGKTQISSKLDTSNIPMGSSKTLSLSILSTGNITGIKDINLNFPNNLRTYAEPPKLEKLIKERTLTYKQTVNISLIPTTPGKIEIPPLKLTYFDPESKTYQTAVSQSYSFLVTGSAPDKEISKGLPPVDLSQTVKTSESNTQIETNNRIIEFLSKASEAISLSLSLLILSFVILLWLFVYLFLYFRKSAKQKNKELKIDFIKVKSLEELHLQIQQKLCAMLNLESNSHPDLIKSQLNEQLPKSTALNICVLLDQVDSARFSPNKSATLSQLKKQAQEIL